MTTEIEPETQSTACRLIIVDDHALVREGLSALLSAVPGIRVIGKAGSGDEALQMVAREEPDVMLLDVGMRGMSGIDLAAELHRRHPHIRVLMLSMFDNREYVKSAIRVGARGYLLKEAPTEDIVRAIGAVCDGGHYFSALLSGMDDVMQGTDEHALTAREHSVLLLLAHGRSNKLVARELDISVRTVEAHRLNLRRKLGVDSASELLKIAVAKGWTTL